MRRTVMFAAALVLSLSFSAVAAESAKPAANKHVHAPKNVKPGSYEDWCDEHKVAESQCTRCDASLIPAFKATGDWCKKHGLPNSQCKKCNPKLKITRPPKGGK